MQKKFNFFGNEGVRILLIFCIWTEGQTKSRSERSPGNEA
nr:MAG TPA: hypothetical protein [Caudoviricetes sp.]